MRTHNWIVVLMFVGLSVGGCQSTPNTAVESEPTAAQTGSIDSPTATLWVLGMGCPQCSNNVDEQLLKVQGVENAKVDLATGRVTVALADANRPTREQLAKAIADSGFTLRKIDVP